jgi:hypothetical protein
MPHSQCVLVRSPAAEWNLDPKRIGFSGFSAGGEVTGMMETRLDPGKPDSSDPAERVSSRPDFTVTVYPAYRPGPIGPTPRRFFPYRKTCRPRFWYAPTMIARMWKPRSNRPGARS